MAVTELSVALDGSEWLGVMPPCPVEVGRGAAEPFALTGPRVPRRHARFEHRADGGFRR